MKSYLLSFFVLVTLLADRAASQSAFLQDGQNGTAFAGSFTLNRDAYSVAGTIGFSVKGRLDIRLTAAYASYYDINFSGTAYAPTFEYHFLRSDLSFSGGFSVEAASLTHSFTATSEISTTSIAVFGTVYRSFPLEEDIAFQVSYQPRHVWSTFRSGDFTVISFFGQETFSQPNQARVDFWVHSFDITAIFTTSDKKRILVTPAILVTEGITTWGIQIGVVY